VVSTNAQVTRSPHLTSSGVQYLKLDLAEFPIVKQLAERCFAPPALSTSHPFQHPDHKTGASAH